MDKTEEKALDFMLAKSYSETIHKSISAFVLMALSEIRSTLSITDIASILADYPPELHAAISHETKNRVFFELLKKDKTKLHILSVLDETAKKRDDLIEEIIKQYGLGKDNEVTEIHYKMGKIFDASFGKIKEAINKGNYEYIYGKWRE